MIDQIFGIGRLGQAREVKRVGKAGSAGSASFAKHLGETPATEEAGATGATQSLTGVTFVLGAQEVDDVLARAARGKARAEDIIKMLEDLRLELLFGAISHGKLQALSQSLAQHRPAIADPALNGLLDEVDLRAQVELAKYAMRPR